jgi:predicted PurR-regulated permease PerM
MTAALRPSVDFLVERGVRAPLARALVYLLVFGILALGLYLISESLLNELRVLSNYVVVAYQNTYKDWLTGTSMQQAIAARLPAPDQMTETVGGSAGATALQLLFGVTQNLGTIAAGLVIIVVLSLYWSADRSHFERLWLSLLPAGRRIQARRIWQKTEGTLAIGYALVGNDFPILTGLLAGIAWIIPLVGFVFAALFSFLMGLASTGDLFPAVASLVMTAVVLAFLEFVVEPRLFRRSQFSGVLIIVVIAMMVDAYGLTGFLIAPPLAVALQVLLGQVTQAIRRGPTTAVELDTIEKRLEAVNELYPLDESGNGGMPPDVASLYGRLKELVAEAREAAVQEGLPGI